MDKFQNKTQDCEACYKIKCKNCGWEPNDIQLSKVLNNEITICPDCGRAP
jgi:hypothetical protein